MNDALVVTVGYNSAAALRKHCRLSPRLPELRFLIVDNRSSDDTTTSAAELGAEVFVAERNEGFGRACNLGVTKNDGEHWIVFLNPDVSITADQLLALIANAPNDTVAISPLLVDSLGEPQADLARRLPTAGDFIKLYLLGASGATRDGAAARSLAKTEESLVDVEVTSGACLAVRRHIFEAAGGFPEWLFLNYEDVFLCRQIARFGSIKVDKRIVAFHEKASSSTDVRVTGRPAETARAAGSYAAATGGWIPWIGVVAAVLAGSTIRWVRKPMHLAQLATLSSTMISEGWAIRKGRAVVAEAKFI